MTMAPRSGYVPGCFVACIIALFGGAIAGANCVRPPRCGTEPKASLPEGGGSRLRLTEGVVLPLVPTRCLVFPLQLCLCAACGRSQIAPTGAVTKRLPCVKGAVPKGLRDWRCLHHSVCRGAKKQRPIPQPLRGSSLYTREPFGYCTCRGDLRSPARCT